MPAEKEPELSLPAYESVIPDQAIVDVLGEVVKAKHGARDAVSLITRSLERASERKTLTPPLFGQEGSTFRDEGDLSEFMRPSIMASERADGMVHALDKLAPLTGGGSWDEVANQLVDAPTPETQP